jgi:hypothetical protein
MGPVRVLFDFRMPRLGLVSNFRRRLPDQDLVQVAQIKINNVAAKAKGACHCAVPSLKFSFTDAAISLRVRLRS